MPVMIINDHVILWHARLTIMSSALPPPPKCESPSFGLLKNGIPNHEGASSQNLVCSTKCHRVLWPTVVAMDATAEAVAFPMPICYETHANHFLRDVCNEAQILYSFWRVSARLQRVTDCHSGTCCSNLSCICKLVSHWKLVHWELYLNLWPLFF
jgi:hypothetical protein